MPRPTNELMKKRYAAINKILDLHSGEVLFEDGSHNIDRIREILKKTYAMSISDRHLREMLKEGRGGVNRKKKDEPVNVNFNSLIKDFQSAIRMVKGIMKDPDANAKLKLDAMKTMRELETGLIKLVDSVNSAEIEKASLNRPHLHLRFGTPSETTVENLAKKKIFEAPEEELPV